MQRLGYPQALWRASGVASIPGGRFRAILRPTQPTGCVMTKKMLAEFIGTLTLVLVGCGAAVLGGDHVGQLGIALAFGFAIVAMAYAIGPVSGCHVNPAVSLAVFVAGRMTVTEMLAYWVA